MALPLLRLVKRQVSLLLVLKAFAEPVSLKSKRVKRTFPHKHRKKKTSSVKVVARKGLPASAKSYAAESPSPFKWTLAHFNMNKIRE